MHNTLIERNDKKLTTILSQDENNKSMPLIDDNNNNKFISDVNSKKSVPLTENKSENNNNNIIIIDNNNIENNNNNIENNIYNIENNNIENNINNIDNNNYNKKPIFQSQRTPVLSNKISPILSKQPSALTSKKNSIRESNLENMSQNNNNINNTNILKLNDITTSSDNKSNNINENNMDEEYKNSPEYQKYLAIKAQQKQIKDSLKATNVPEENSGKIALKCWNCNNINLVNPKWEIIQCPICNTLNKIPHPETKLNQILNYLKANQTISFADKEHLVPLVNYIVVCPYCKTDNKVRETACFCICYKCNNRWTIQQPNYNKKNDTPPNPIMEGNYYKYDTKKRMVYPPEKILRFSDLFFPDPMFFPGYFPINSISPLYPDYFNPLDDFNYIDRLKKMNKYYRNIRNEKILMDKNIDLNNNNNNVIINNNMNNNNNMNKRRISKKNSNKNYLLNELQKLDKKFEEQIQNRYKINNDFNMNNNNNNINNDNNSKIKAMENTFFMK